MQENFTRAIASTHATYWTYLQNLHVRGMISVTSLWPLRQLLCTGSRELSSWFWQNNWCKVILTILNGANHHGDALFILTATSEHKADLQQWVLRPMKSIAPYSAPKRYGLIALQGCYSSTCSTISGSSSWSWTWSMLSSVRPFTDPDFWWRSQSRRLDPMKPQGSPARLANATLRVMFFCRVWFARSSAAASMTTRPERGVSAPCNKRILPWLLEVANNRQRL